MRYASGLTVKYGYRQPADTDQAVFFIGDPCFPYMSASADVYGGNPSMNNPAANRLDVVGIDFQAYGVLLIQIQQRRRRLTAEGLR